MIFCLSLTKTLSISLLSAVGLGIFVYLGSRPSTNSLNSSHSVVQFAILIVATQIASFLVNTLYFSLCFW